MYTFFKLYMYILNTNVFEHVHLLNFVKITSKTERKGAKWFTNIIFLFFILEHGLQFLCQQCTVCFHGPANNIIHIQ